MFRHRSSLPLVLVLALAVGAGVFWRWSEHSTAGANRVDRSSSGESLAGIPEEFGPIPLANVPNDDPVSPPVRDAEGTSGDMRQLAARMSRETGDLEIATHPDGRRSVSLKGRFLHMSAVVINADGKPEVRCFTDFQQMTAALPGNPPAEPPHPTIHAR